MGSHELSPELQQRLEEALGSYEELQVLLYALRQGAPWSADDATGDLPLSRPSVGEAIEGLLARGFLADSGNDVPDGKRFLYRPATPELAELTERLAEMLDRNPLHVVDLMNRHALERLRTSAMQTFAGAFVLGRKKDG